MLEDSRTRLAPFMVSRFYGQSGIFEVLKPSLFPDVMESINLGGVIRPPRRDVIIRQVCMCDSGIVTVPQQHQRKRTGGVGGSHGENRTG